MFKILCSFYKLKNCVNVFYFNEHFCTRNLLHNYNTSSAKDFYVNFTPKGNYGYATFHFKSITYWNSLPIEIKSTNNFNGFKNKLKKHLLEKSLNCT